MTPGAGFPTLKNPGPILILRVAVISVLDEFYFVLSCTKEPQKQMYTHEISYLFRPIFLTFLIKRKPQERGRRAEQLSFCQLIPQGKRKILHL